MKLLLGVVPGEKRWGLAEMREGSTEIVRSALIDRPDSPEEFQEALRKNGFTSHRAVIILPRHQCLIREFELPPGVLEELHLMAQFQLEKELAVPIADVFFSFTMKPTGDGKIAVVAVAARREDLKPTLAMLEGISISSVHVSSWVAARLAPRDGVLIHLHEGWAEAEVVQAGNPRCARAFHATSEQTLVECDRALAQFTGQVPDLEAQTVYILGEGSQVDPIAEGLSQRRGLRVERLKTPVHPTLALAAQAASCGGPDLLAEPFRRPWWRKYSKLLAGGAIGVAAIAMMAYAQIKLAGLRGRLDQVRIVQKGLKPQLDEVAQLEDRLQRARQWAEHRASPLAVLHAMTETLEATRANGQKVAYLQELSIAADGAEIRITGRARQEGAVHDLARRLSSIPSFRQVNLENFAPRADRRVPDFPVHFTIRVSWTPEEGS